MIYPIINFLHILFKMYYYLLKQRLQLKLNVCYNNMVKCMFFPNSESALCVMDNEQRKSDTTMRVKYLRKPLVDYIIHTHYT